MNATTELLAQEIEIGAYEQELRSLADIELVLVGGGEFLALGG